MLSDVIADMFTRIRNALKENHEYVEVPYSKFKFQILKILEDNGFITSFQVNSLNLHKKNIIIKLKYNKQGNSVISNIEKVSKASRRVYLKKKNIPKILSGFGISIISTSKGLLTGKQARINNLGGEIIGVVW